VSGGRGPGGYPGPGYDAPDYDDRRGRPRRPGGGQQREESVWQGDHGYAGQGYGNDDEAYENRGRDPRGYGQPGGPGYPPPGPGGGYHYPDNGQYQGPGPQPGQYGGGAGPRFAPPGAQRDQRGDQPGRGARRPADGYDQRGDGGYGPGGPGGQGGPGGYGDWEQDQGDDSFLPGFGRRDEYDRRGAARAPQRDGRYDYDDRRGAPGERGGPGPGPRGRDDGRDDGPGDRDAWGEAWDDRDRKPRKKATRWLPRILILTVVAAIAVGGLVGGLDVYHKYQARYHPPDYAGEGTGNVTVQVESGDTAFSLAPRLLQLGVIASTRAFTNAAEAATSTASASSSGLQAGFYQLHEHMQASLAYAAVTNAKNVVQTTVTIPEGKRAVDVIAILAEKTKIPLKNFQQALASPAQLGLPSYAGGKVEGYLFPATYAVVPHETALQILQAMVQRFNVEAQATGLAGAAKAVGLTPAQLVIEASLAQAEGGSVSDYPKIAEVIHNRLAIGMHLQFDSTVLYGLGKYAVSATIKQTKTPGPYNTYLNAGLPAGPISNPGDAAIQGVLHPATGDYLYFLTKPGGKSEFSHTPLTGQ
jgi:uncharacterized YceG family protein